MASASGFIAPMIVAYFTNERSSEYEWWYIFFICAGMLILSAVIFILFGSVEVQKWNRIEEDLFEEKEAHALVDFSKYEK